MNPCKIERYHFALKLYVSNPSSTSYNNNYISNSSFSISMCTVPWTSALIQANTTPSRTKCIPDALMMACTQVTILHFMNTCRIRPTRRRRLHTRHTPPSCTRLNLCCLRAWLLTVRLSAEFILHRTSRQPFHTRSIDMRLPPRPMDRLMRHRTCHHCICPPEVPSNVSSLYSYYETLY